MKLGWRLCHVLVTSVATMCFSMSAWGQEQPAPYRLEVLADPIPANLRKLLAPVLKQDPLDVRVIESLIRTYYRIHGQGDMKLSSLVDEETGLVLIHLENPHVPAKSGYSYAADPRLSQEARDRRQEPLDALESAHVFWKTIDKLGQ
jgi:hypothetical protein